MRVYRYLHGHAKRHVPHPAVPGMGIDMCTDMCTHMGIDMCIYMLTPSHALCMCRDMCIDVCRDMCIDIPATQQ